MGDERLTNALPLYSFDTTKIDVAIPFLAVLFSSISITKYRNYLYNKKKAARYIIFPSLKNPRWIFPDDKTYICNAGNLVKPTTFLAKVAWRLFKILISLGFPASFAFPILWLSHYDAESTLLSHNLILHLEAHLNHKPLDFILYTGVAGPFQKFTAQVMDSSGQIICFAKMSCTPFGKWKIRSEAKNLRLLSNYRFKYLQHPLILADSTYDGYKVLIQSSPDASFTNPGLDLRDIHLNALAELFTVTAKFDLTFGALVSAAREALVIENKHSILLRSAEIILNAADQLVSVFPDNPIVIGFSHGDFSPWNILCDSNQLYLYDWELGKYRTPYWDILNYVSHRELLVSKNTPSRILINLHSLFNKIELYTLSIPLVGKYQFDTYLNIFLLDISIYYHNYVATKLRLNIDIADKAEHYLYSFTKMLSMNMAK